MYIISTRFRVYGMYSHITYLLSFIVFRVKTVCKRREIWITRLLIPIFETINLCDNILLLWCFYCRYRNGVGTSKGHNIILRVQIQTSMLCIIIIYIGARGILYRSKNRDKPHYTEVRSKRIDTYIMYTIYIILYYTYAHCIGAYNSINNAYLCFVCALHVYEIPWSDIQYIPCL